MFEIVYLIVNFWKVTWIQLLFEKRKEQLGNVLPSGDYGFTLDNID